jgi:hypothetical protein
MKDEQKQHLIDMIRADEDVLVYTEWFKQFKNK